MSNVLWQGIDISKYQTNVDFKKLKDSGYTFVIIKAGYGKYENQIDPYFEKHYKGAKEAGLYVGAYWYSYAKSKDDAELESKACINALKGKIFEMPIYYDIEERSTLNTGKTNVTNIAKTFCNNLEKANYFCGIYGGQELAEQYLTEEVRNRYAFWLAQYLKTPRYKGQYGMWQYGVAGANSNNNPTGTKSVPGVVGQCDMDYCYVDYYSLITKKNMNGLTNISNATPTKQNPYKEPTTPIKEGSGKNDVQWLQWYLKNYKYYNSDITGNFDLITLGSLLAYQFKNDLEVDGICGPKTKQSLKNK